MTNRLGAALVLLNASKPSTYRQMYKKFGVTQTRKTLKSMSQQATSISPSNKNLFKDAIKYSPQAVSNKPKQNSKPTQTKGSKLKQTVSNKSRKKRATRKAVSTADSFPTGLNIG